MIKGTTKSGFEFGIPEENIDDYELMEMLTEIDKGNQGLIIEAVEKLIGKEQKDKLKDHVRDEKGRVKLTTMIVEVMDIFTASDPGKNF